jgi:DNA repair protein SbcD/Mre11
MKIFVAADIHLGKRTCGIGVFGDDCATKQTWKRMTDYVIQNAIDVVVLPGDVIDQDNRYYEASGALQEGFTRLKDQGIAIMLVSGNHDYDVLPQVLRNHPFENVHQLGENGRWDCYRFEKNEEVIQFVGWSFPSRYVSFNPLRDLSHLSTDPNFLRFGVLHADVDNLTSSYAPVPLIDLQNAPVDLWMLGHIHKPVIFGGDKIIRYPGSPQALSAKEAGPHGGLIMEVNGREIRVEEIAFSNCRFESLVIDVLGSNTAEEIRGLAENELTGAANSLLRELDGVRHLVYDLYLTGSSRRGREIIGWTKPLTSWFERDLATGTKVHVRTVSGVIRPIVEDLEILARELTPAGLLAQSILALRNGDSTPFLDDLEGQWNREFRNFNSSATYQPLQEQWLRSGNNRSARTFIEAECNRLLGQLLAANNA